MAEATAPAPEGYQVVSHEVNGRVLSGVSVDQDQLAETMERHAPAPAETPAAPAPTKPSGPPANTLPPRDANGAFQAAPEAKKLRGQARFDELTREREDARREAAAAKKEADDLRARLAQGTPSVAPAPSQPVAAAAVVPQPPAPTAPVIPSYQQWAQTHPGQDYDAYTHFVARTELQQQQTSFDARIRQSIEADRASRSLAEHVAKSHADARQVYADFDAVLAQGPGSQVILPTDRVLAIATAPQGAHLQYVIAQDAALAQRLATCHPIEFGFLLAQLTPPAAGASPASPARSGASVPPPPYQPVGAGSKTTGSPSAELARKGGSDYDRSGYRERRAAERGVKLRRV